MLKIYQVRIAFYGYLTEKIKVQRRNMLRFKASVMINLQYEIRIWLKILNKATNDKNQSGQ